jgi:hypothetical protein
MLSDARKNEIATEVVANNQITLSLEGLQDQHSDTSKEIVGTIPGADPNSRIALELSHSGQIDLCNQSFGNGIGWFTQNRSTLTPEQLVELQTLIQRVSGTLQEREAEAANKERVIPIRPGNR